MYRPMVEIEMTAEKATVDLSIGVASRKAQTTMKIMALMGVPENLLTLESVLEKGSAPSRAKDQHILRFGATFNFLKWQLARQFMFANIHAAIYCQLAGSTHHARLCVC